MKQQFVVTHRYTVLQETEQIRDMSFIDQHLNMSGFYENIIIFFGWGIQNSERRYVVTCLIMQESQFDELCELRQIAVS
jgi:hypothetical protein